MELCSLTAITPIDGRYRCKIQELQSIFSEFGLLKYRYLVELRWLQRLAEQEQIQALKPFSQRAGQVIEHWITTFDVAQAARIKAIEKEIKHDVKAVEYFVKEQLKTDEELRHAVEFVHFACTSEDINNIAYALMLDQALQRHCIPLFETVLTCLESQARHFADVPMLARTHGQVASPTTLGKEWINVCARLKRQQRAITALRLCAKCNGAVGNFNAHHSAYPDLDWPSMTSQFIQDLGLSPNMYTTQIEPHDVFAELFDALARYNQILIDFSRDVWGYVALGLLKQKAMPREVGSSTMPHKINPIDFENAEGNLGLANALLGHFSSTLPISRWQRDLSDSTVQRNFGCAFGYMLVAYQSLLQGLDKIDMDRDAMRRELEQNWQVLAEPLQTVMRCHGLEKPYEQLKELTRDKVVLQQELHDFISNLSLPDDIKNRLKSLKPEDYTGLAQHLIERYFSEKN